MNARRHLVVLDFHRGSVLGQKTIKKKENKCCNNSVSKMTQHWLVNLVGTQNHDQNETFYYAFDL